MWMQMDPDNLSWMKWTIVYGFTKYLHHQQDVTQGQFFQQSTYSFSYSCYHIMDKETSLSYCLPSARSRT